MPSRSARRNAHKRQSRCLQRIEASHSPLVCRWLEHWRVEARCRASRLGAPAAWRLLREPTVLALLQQLDETGELAAELGSVIAEAVAWACDPRLLCSSRPVSQPVKSRG